MTMCQRSAKRDKNWLLHENNKFGEAIFVFISM